MKCNECGKGGAMMTYNNKPICIHCFTRDVQGFKKVDIDIKRQTMTNYDKNFDYNLKRAEQQRLEERRHYRNSAQYKLDEVLTDFKCWCFSKGKFLNIDENDFKKYKEENNKNFDFNFEMQIFTQWFGYEFEFDEEKNRWRVKDKSKRRVINYV